MLYITTRDCADFHTAHKTLCNSMAPDGGCFVPFHMEPWSKNDIMQLSGKSFNQNLADILNYFFSSQITAWDVETCIGRNAFRMAQLNRKIVLAELWHNPGASYDYAVSSLYSRICKEGQPTEWFGIAVRVAVLFGVVGEMVHQGLLQSEMTVDVATAADNFSETIAAWYARAMGLPIGTIICGCSNHSVWELVHRGELNTNQISEKLSYGLERLIAAAVNLDSARCFRQQVNTGGIYTLDSFSQQQLRSGVFASVISEPRVDSVINSVFRTCETAIDPKSAIAYSSIQDFRSRSGANNFTVLFADDTPMKAADAIQSATGISAEALSMLCDNH